MQKKTTFTQELFNWGSLILFSFSTIVLMVILLTNIPNPLPIIILLIAYGIFGYIFRAHKAKLITLLLFLVVTFSVMIDTMDTSAVGLKCSPELRKNYENRDMKIAEIEAKNFDSCLNSITFFDNVRYGLLQ